MTAGVVCPECRGVNAAGAKSCRHCLSFLRDPGAVAATVPAIGRMRGVQEVLRGEERLLDVLRWLYVLYAALYASRAAFALAALAFDAPGPRVLAFVLLSLVGLATVIVAIRHLVYEPFACAVAMAGLQTIWIANLIAERGAAHAQLPLTVAALLWLAALATARSSRILREWQSRLAYDAGRTDELRTVLTIFLLYAGTLALVLVMPGGAFWHEVAAYGAIAALAAAGALLLGPRSFRETLPIRCRWQSALLLTASLTAVDFGITWWFVGLQAGSWTPPALTVGPFPGTEFLILSVALPALCEEWLCRGVLWTAVRRGAGTTATILVTATLFALLHRTGSRADEAVPLQFVGGLLLGWLRARTGSLLPGILSHAAFNAAVVWLL